MSPLASCRSLAERFGPSLRSREPRLTRLGWAPSGRSVPPRELVHPGLTESRLDLLFRGDPRRHTTLLGQRPPLLRATRPLRLHPEEVYHRAGTPQRTPAPRRRTGRCRPAARTGPQPSADSWPPWMECSPQLAEVRSEPAVAAPEAALGARTAQARSHHGWFASARPSRRRTPGTVGSSREASSACRPIPGFSGNTPPTKDVGPCRLSARAGRNLMLHFKVSSASMRAGTVPSATSSGTASVPGLLTVGCACGVLGSMTTQ